MAVAKVTLNGTTLMDTTDATASADKILNTYTAYIKDGTKTVGTLVPQENTDLININACHRRIRFYLGSNVFARRPSIANGYAYDCGRFCY